MTSSFTRAFAVCALAAAAAAPALAANDLTGTTVAIDWKFPNSTTTYATNSVLVGPGAEVSCAGGGAGTGLCVGFIDGATIDLGSNTLSLTIDSGTAPWSTAGFNGYEFSGLAVGGAWTGYSLATTFAGLDASRITFTPDAVWVNMEGISPTAGESFTISLTAVPEPTSPALLLAGLGALACIARRRRA